MVLINQLLSVKSLHCHATLLESIKQAMSTGNNIHNRAAGYMLHVKYHAKKNIKYKNKNQLHFFLIKKENKTKINTKDFA